MMAGQEVEYCEICARTGKISTLKVYQINFEEAIRFCENDECTYPVGLNKSDKVILIRNFADISLPSRTKFKNKGQIGRKLIARKDLNTPACVLQQEKVPQLGDVKNPKSTTASIYVPNKARLPYIHKKDQEKTDAKTTPYVITKKIDIMKKQSVCIENSGADKDLADSESKLEHDCDLSQNTTCVETKSSLNASAVKNKEFKNKYIPKLTVKQGHESIRSADQMGSAAASFVSNNVDVASQLNFPQWQNKEALCWLDVVMCLLVHSDQMRKLEQSGDEKKPMVVTTLIRAYDQAVSLLNKCVKEPKVKKCQTLSTSHIDKVDVNQSDCPLMETETSVDVSNDLGRLSLQDQLVKTGAGLKVLKPDFMKLVAKYGDPEYTGAFNILNDVREKIWHILHPRLQCQKGKNDSPVWTIQLMAKRSPSMERVSSLKYSFNLKCSQCGYKRTDRQMKVLPTFPNTPSDFSMDNPSFVRACFVCQASKQRMKMHFERIPAVLMLHFQEGVPHNEFATYDFYHNSVHYRVTGIIQYRNDPDHFVAWIRNVKDNSWMECDDLKSALCSFQHRCPNFPASQVHIMMWEAESEEETQVKYNCNIKPNIDLAKTSVVKTNIKTSSLEQEKSLQEVTTMSCNNLQELRQKYGNGQTASLNSDAVKSKKPVIPERIVSAQAIVSPIDLQYNTQLPFSANMTVKILPSGRIVPDSSCSVKAGQSSLKGVGTTNLKTNMMRKVASTLSGSAKTTEKTEALSILKMDNLTLLKSMQKNPLSLKNVKIINGQPFIMGSKAPSCIETPVANAQTCQRNKLFAGYRSKSTSSMVNLRKSNMNSRSSSPVSDDFDSQPPSPALSCHSDTYVINKRKADMIQEGNSQMQNIQKRRKSEDIQKKNLHIDKLSRSRSFTCSNFVSFPESSQFSTSDSILREENLIVNVQNQYQASEVPHTKENNEGLDSEREILESLYSNLNLTMPSDMKMSVLECGEEVENLPDISDLDEFISTPVNDSCLAAEGGLGSLFAA